jgi:hypothetical protein
MKAVKFNSLGVEATLLVYESVKEGDQAAGKEDAVLDECNKNLAYRGALPVFRDKYTAAVAEHTGRERRSEVVKKNADGSDVEKWTETEGEYIKSVCAELGVEPSSFQHLADAIGPIEVDIKVPERTPTGPKKLHKDFLEASERIFANGNEAKWAKELKITLTGEREKDVLTLGWAIKAREDAARKERVLTLA